MSEFRSVLSDFRQLGSLALKGVVAAPLMNVWSGLGPPPAKGIAILTSLLEFAAVIWVFQFWYSAKDRRLHMRMKVAITLFCVGLLASLLLLGKFSVSPGEGRERVIEGWSVRTDVKPLLNSSYTPEQALRDTEYNAERIWTKGSIVVLQALIAIVWIATFMCLPVYLTAFIILQRRTSNQSGGKSSARGPLTAC